MFTTPFSFSAAQINAAYSSNDPASSRSLYPQLKECCIYYPYSSISNEKAILPSKHPKNSYIVFFDKLKNGLHPNQILALLKVCKLEPLSITQPTSFCYVSFNETDYPNALHLNKRVLFDINGFWINQYLLSNENGSIIHYTMHKAASNRNIKEERLSFGLPRYPMVASVAKKVDGYIKNSTLSPLLPAPNNSEADMSASAVAETSQVNSTPACTQLNSYHYRLSPEYLMKRAPKRA